MDKTVFIYALNCPITGRTRYVGKAKNPKKRFYAHLEQVKKGRHHRANWLRSLLEVGLKPILEVIDEVPEVEWPQWEVAYIQFFREAGFDLVNGNDGGEGGGNNPTPEARAKIRAANLGNKYNLGKKNALGWVPSLETREKIRVAHTGKKQSAETRAKQRAAKLGTHQSPETIAKRVAKTTGMKRTPETIEKMKATWAIRKQKRICQMKI